MSAAPWQKHPDYEQARGAGEIRNILFQNIDITAQSTIGDPETLWGTESAPLRSFIFDNVKIAGELVEDISVFNQNEYVTDMRFTDSSPKIKESSYNDKLHDSFYSDGGKLSSNSKS